MGYRLTNLRTGERTQYDDANWAAFVLGVDTDEMLWAIEEHGECECGEYLAEETE